jgi:predicted ATPase/transcriptional regulator with XRE-family HTH domain
MRSSHPVRITSAIEEEYSPLYFGEWLKRRRQELDLTQVQLAKRACCTVFTIRKIEVGERRPSRQLAGLLAQSLEIPAEDQETFFKVARGELSLERLPSPARTPSREFEPPAGPASVHGNLPRALTPFIGREPELEALHRLIRDPGCSLLTILGPGGIGKTRLAIEIAARQRELFPDGAWFVPLAPLTSSEYLVPAIADALRFRFQDPTTPLEQLLNYLQGKNALLVLDNSEHLLDGVDVFTEILKHCPGVKLLVTSRERLNLLSEWVFEIHGLPVPRPDQAEQFEEYSSTALFLQSARRVQAGYEVQEEDRQWVARICQVMEGLPLGIELAAAWVGILSCAEIAREIERNLDFLEAPLRDMPERQRSLRATLDHSWNLLDSEEKAVLSRLSVFRGSFHREAAEEICGAGLTTLSSLKDKSLLRRADGGFYDLHELIRQYAALRLAEDVSEDYQVKDRHAHYFAKRLSEWEKALKSSRQAEALDEIELEIDNLRLAWQRMVTRCGLDGHENALFSQDLLRSSLFSLSLFFEMRCRYWEAVNLFDQAAETLKTTRKSASKMDDLQSIDSLLGRITAFLGYHQYLQLYYQAGETLAEAFRLLENDTCGKGQAQVILAWIYQAQGRYQEAADLFQHSLVAFQQEKDEWWYTLALSYLAGIFLAQGNIQECVPLLQESLKRIEAGDLRLGAITRTCLGYAYFFLGDYAGAERLLQESLCLNDQLGNTRQMAYNHRILGQVALASGKVEEAQARFQQCVDHYSSYGESTDQALGLVYLGKGFVARMNLDAAREAFRKVIKIGQVLNVFYLVYWGFVNLARVILLSGQPEKALETILILQQYTVESKVIRDDSDRLLAELQNKLELQQVEEAVERVKGMDVDSLLAQA